MQLKIDPSQEVWQSDPSSNAWAKVHHNKGGAFVWIAEGSCSGSGAICVPLGHNGEGWARFSASSRALLKGEGRYGSEVASPASTSGVVVVLGSLVADGRSFTEEVVFYEDGEPIIDGEPGDLKFRILTAPHERFKREGNDLHTTVTISLLKALVGFDKTITHLDEHLVEIGTKGITKPKDVRRFKGEGGMPLHLSSKKGDLYVTFEVSFPTSLTEDQKTKLKAILT